MEYLVMECGLSYAVVLDGQGRFLKVPNLGYEVGQTLDHVILQEMQAKSSPVGKRFARWAVMAACLCVMVLGSWGFWQSPVGTVRMQINPDVQMRVNRFDRVVGLDGLNEDGEDLIDGYRAYGKEIKAVSDELADRAVERGYLRDGGKITLTVESSREDWKTATEELLLLELDVHFDHRVTVAAASDDSPKAPDRPFKPADVIVIQPEQVEEDSDDGHNEDDDRDNDDPDDDMDNDADDDDGRDDADDRDDDDDPPDMEDTGEDKRSISDDDPDDDIPSSESDHDEDDGNNASDDGDFDGDHDDSDFDDEDDEDGDDEDGDDD